MGLPIPFTLPRTTTLYSVPGTKTFRLGSRKLPIRIGKQPECFVGQNLQNQERSAKRIYISDGWDTESPEECEKLAHYLLHRDTSIFTEEQLARIKLFVKPDQSGAEAVIVAYLCRHGNYRELIKYNIKIHVFVCLHVFADEWKKEVKNFGSDLVPDIDALCHANIPSLTSFLYWKQVDKLIKDSDKWPSERRFYFIGKQIAHSSNYGVQAGMFQLNTLEKSKGRIVISKEDAERYLTLYHGLFPEIHEWHREVEQQLAATKTLYNLFGYPRYFWFPEKYPNKETLKEAYAFVPQSTVGTITNMAATNLQTGIEEGCLNWDLLGNEHDSYMSQCPIGQEAICGNRMQGLITEIPLTSPNDGTRFNMKSEIKVGFNWSDHSDKNPLGLIEL